MGFETKWAGAAIRPTRDRRAPKSYRHGSWIEQLLSSAFRTVVEGFALYGAALYPGPFLSADDQPRFPGFDEIRRDGSRAAWEDIDNQTVKDIGIPDETEHAESHKPALRAAQSHSNPIPAESGCGEAEARQDRGQQAGAVHLPRVGH